MLRAGIIPWMLSSQNRTQKHKYLGEEQILWHEVEQVQVNSSVLSQSNIGKKVSEHLAAAGPEFSDGKTQPTLFKIRDYSSKMYPASAAGMK